MKEKHYLGIDMGASKVRVGLVRVGELLEVDVNHITGSDKAALIIKEIIDGIERVITPLTKGIGMGVPSVVDVDKGIVYDVVNIPAWNEIHLKEILENQFKIPVHIDNDVNCFAMGENFYGNGVGYHNVVGAALGSGIGSGIIMDGRLYRGSNCGAGEVGMLPYKDSILEHYASSQFFERQYNMKGNEVFKRAEKGDSQALQAYDEFGVHVGNAMKMIMYAYDPEIIILGGGVSCSFRFFEQSMFRELAEFEYSQSVDNIKIAVSTKEHIAIFGAAKLAMQVA